MPAPPATALSKEVLGAMQIKASANQAAGASGAQMMAHLPLHQRQPLLHRPQEEPARQPLHVIGIVLVVHAAVVTFPPGCLSLNRHFAILTPCSPPLLTTLMEPNSMERQPSLRVWEGGTGCPVDVASAGRSLEPAMCPDFLE